MIKKFDDQRKIYKFIFIAVVILVGIRILLPPAIKVGANYFLKNKLDAYEGWIEDIDLAIFRASYNINGFKIWKKAKTIKDPLLSVNRIQFSLAWKPLSKGRIVGDVIINTAELEVLLSEKEEKKQIATEKVLRQWANKLIPVKIESIQILNCSVLVKNNDYKGSPQFLLDDIYIAADNLTNVKDLREALSSKISARARVQRSSIIKSELKANLTKDPPLLDANVKMEKLDLTKLNSFLLAYNMVTFNKGHFSLYSEFEVKNNRIKGYIKPFFEDIDVISSKEKFGSSRRAMLEIGAALGNLILRNKDKTVASKIEFEGAVESPDIEKEGAFWTSIHNAFINALKKGIENSISIKDVSASKKIQ